ncbi:MAG TPA: hypothetical protein VFC76_06440 [Oscillospiraceae bacterium]|nr:hypothetical protein [Oscillospiraceae bacterium]
MKNLFSKFLIIITMCACFAMTAFAIDTPNVVARLSTTMTSAQSVTTAGTHKFYGGNNQGSSKHSVDFIAQRSAGNKFVTDSKTEVTPGKEIDNVLTGFTGSTVLWRLELNPVGLGKKGCTATGYMWYLM